MAKKAFQKRALLYRKLSFKPIKKRAAFTLIELIIVILIISLLALIAIPAYKNYRYMSIKALLIADLRSCITHLAGDSALNETINAQEVVASCPRSSYTDSITVESQNGSYFLTATSREIALKCFYYSNGTVLCESPFH